MFRGMGDVMRGWMLAIPMSVAKGIFIVYFLLLIYWIIKLPENEVTLTLESGKTMAKLSIATSDSYVSKDGEVIKTTQWHNVIAWNKQAELAEKYLSKGQQVCVSGKLNNRSYEDKDGTKKYITEIVCNELVMLGGK